MIATLWIPPSGLPQLLTEDFETSKSYVFKDTPVEQSTFDGTVYYCHVPSYLADLYPANIIGTFLKRLYTSSYSITNTLKGDLLLFSYFDKQYDTPLSIPYYFIEHITNYIHNNSYEKSTS